MDAISTDPATLHYSDLPPALLVASSVSAMPRAERSALAGGFRVGARMLIEGAAERIERQIATGALWIELDSDGGEGMDALLSQVSRDVADERYPAVVSATAD